MPEQLSQCDGHKTTFLFTGFALMHLQNIQS